MAGIASAIQSGIAWVVSSTVDWWVQVPSPDLAAEPAVGALQRWMLPVTVAIAVLAMLAAAGKMALTRKANPLIDVGARFLAARRPSSRPRKIPHQDRRAARHPRRAEPRRRRTPPVRH